MAIVIARYTDGLTTHRFIKNHQDGVSVMIMKVIFRVYKEYALGKKENENVLAWMGINSIKTERWNKNDYGSIIYFFIAPLISRVLGSISIIRPYYTLGLIVSILLLLSGQWWNGLILFLGSMLLGIFGIPVSNLIQKIIIFNIPLKLGWQLGQS
jgi:hypothetical protein